MPEDPLGGAQERARGNTRARLPACKLTLALVRTGLDYCVERGPSSTAHSHSDSHSQVADQVPLALRELAFLGLRMKGGKRKGGVPCQCLHNN